MTKPSKYIIRIVLPLFFFSLSCEGISDVGNEHFQFGYSNYLDPYFYAQSFELQFNDPITYNIHKLDELKSIYNSNPKDIPSSAISIIDEANNLLSIQPISVVNRAATIDNISPNDFLSLSTYYWPNPDSENGLPYIRIDGQRNPEVFLYNRQQLSELRFAITNLVFAYHITSEEKFANKAISLLEAWFISPTTRMNPNLQHAQFIPGISDGSFTGIIQGRVFIYIFDSLILLKSSPVWSTEFEKELFVWIREFNKWLINSGHGKIASDYINNHSTWYDAQVAYYSSLTRKNETLLRTLESVYQKRILTQIDENGVQIHEVKRNKGLHYSNLNLTAHVFLLKIGDNVNYINPAINSEHSDMIFSATDFMRPSVIDQEVWPYRQIDPFNGCGFIPILDYAYQKSGFEEYNNELKEVNSIYTCAPSTILY